MHQAGREPRGPGAPHGARLMQELLDHDTRPVPAVLRAVGDAAPRDLRGPPGALHEPCRARARGRQGVATGVADGVSRGADPRGRRPRRLRRPGPVARRGAQRRPTRSAPFTTRVCTGARDCAPQPGHIDELRCPFHGFTWNLDGTFAGMPCPWDFPHVDPATFCLPEARVGAWGGFVFVTRRPRRPEPRGVPRDPARALRVVGPRPSVTSARMSCGSSRAIGRWRSRRSSRATTPSPCIPSCSRPAATPRPSTTCTRVSAT